MKDNFEELLTPLFIEGLQQTATWLKGESDNYLRSIFDQVGFRDRKPEESTYYVPPDPLCKAPVFPVERDSSMLMEARKRTSGVINECYGGFSKQYLEHLGNGQLFFMLEKFGTNVPASENSELSVFDTIKMQAAEAVIAANRTPEDLAPRLLTVADISGIQKFIYNIVSSGALKNLRSRSFFIELLGHHIVSRIVDIFGLHQVNILMNGGGTVHILSHCPKDYEGRLKDIDAAINSWLLGEFNGNLHLSLCATPWQEGEALEKVLDRAAELIFTKKNRRFEYQIEQGKLKFVEEEDPGYERCEVCHKDGEPDDLHEKRDDDGGTGDYRCPLCHTLVQLGQLIPKVRFIYRCYEDPKGDAIRIENSLYLLSENPKENLECCWVVFDSEDRFIDELPVTATPIFARTYTKLFSDLPIDVVQKYPDSKPDDMATMEHLADSATGAGFIGALRMDADNMGKILRHGFLAGPTLERLSAFSRNVNYFFRLHLEHICREGFNHDKSYNILKMPAKGRLVQVIYSGGDDLVAVGAWNETGALAVDVGRAFGRYTCGNMDMGVSAGFTLHQSRFPVLKMAEESAAALDCAKNETKPCWMCRTNWPTCPILDNGVCLRKNAFAPFYTGYLAYRKRENDERHKTPRYQEHSSRLTLALKWEKWDETGVTDDVEDYLLQPLEIFYKGRSALKRGFFHNSLQLLNTWYDEGVLYLPRLVWSIDKIKQELKRKQEGQDGESLYDLLMLHLHLYNPNQKDGNKKFATLHMPLSWIILLERGGAKNGEN